MEQTTTLQEECARLDQAVDIFAQRMKEKLHKKAAAGYNGWNNPGFSRDIKARMFQCASRIWNGHHGQEIDVANFAMMLFTQSRPDPHGDCICYACAQAGHNGGDEQCACDGIPVFDAARCGSCKHKAVCDVALNPQLYPDASRE